MPATRRPRSPLRRFFGGLLWGLWLGGALLLGVVAGWAGKSKSFSPGNIRKIVTAINEPPAQVFGGDQLTILLLGVDEDLYYGGKQVLNDKARSDMMLVARMDFKTKKITGMSIPRDTRCQLPGYRSMKINAYHKVAKKGEGPQLAKAAVEHLLGDAVKIDRVVVIDYAAFMDFVNLIGGVTVSTPIDLKYVDRAGGLYVDIPKGTHPLGGYDAMGFVRIRKNAGDDYARQDRQKQLLVAVRDQVKKNWTMLPEIVDAGVKVLGGSLDMPEVAALASFARGIPKEEIRLGELPTREGRGSYLEVDERRMRRTLEEYGLVPTTVAAR